MIPFALDSLLTLGKCLAGLAIVAGAVCLCLIVAGLWRGYRDARRRP